MAAPLGRHRRYADRRSLEPTEQPSPYRERVSVADLYEKLLTAWNNRDAGGTVVTRP
jgi:hypothetical protein